MTNVSRRDVLRASGGAGAIALAGCLEGGGSADGGGGNGSGGGGTTSIGVGIPSASTTTGAASNAFQRVVGNASSNTGPAGTIQWSSQETGGDPPSLRQIDQGNVQAITAGNFVIASAMRDLPPFEQRSIDQVPYQAFKIASLHLHIVAIEGSGIRTTDDLVGSNFWPLPPAWGLRQHVQTVFQNAGLWGELEPTVVDADTSAVAGAIEENRIDALMAYGAGFSNLPGWATEVDARAELHTVEMTDSFQQGVETTRGTSFEEIDVYGWEQGMGSETVDTFPADYQFFFSRDLPVDVGHELAKISHENVPAIRESQPAYADHREIGTMTDAYLDDLPVHPGVVEFLQANDAWNDDWERGEANQ